MKHAIVTLTVSLFILFAQAKPWNAASIPAFSDSTRVSNPDGVLSQMAVDSINSMLMQIDKHRVQCVVVVVKNIENDDPYTFAIQLGRRFGVGGKKNQGIVLVLATDDRSYQIVTGEGMEKFLPDIVCSRIERHAMVPYLKKGKWDEAVMAGVRDMKGYLDQEPEIMEQYWGQDDHDGGAALGFLGIFFLCGMGLIIYGIVRAHLNEKKCPHCAKYKLRLVDTQVTKDSSKNTHIFKTFICDNCHNEVKKQQFIPHHDDNGTMGGAAAGSKIGSSFGRSSRSSSSRGGFSSLGGGHFGGGGAGGRF